MAHGAVSMPWGHGAIVAAFMCERVCVMQSWSGLSDPGKNNKDHGRVCQLAFSTTERLYGQWPVVNGRAFCMVASASPEITSL